MTNEWQPIASAPEGQVVQTKIDDGLRIRNVQLLKRMHNLWFFPDASMYVYYTPTHWRALAISANTKDSLTGETPAPKETK